MKKAIFQLNIAVFLAGFTAILGKLISLQEGVLVVYRLLLTVLALAMIFLIKKKPVLIPFKSLVPVFGVGAVIAFHWLTFYGSVKYANISVAVVCLSASGFFTSFLEPLILKRRIRFMEVFLGMLAIAGVYIIFDFHPYFKTGILFGILASVGSSLFPIFNKRLITTYDASLLTFYEMAGGAVFLMVCMPLYLHYFPATSFIPTGQDWIWLILLSVVCTVYCFDLQLTALKKLSPFTANLMYNLEPVYGIILAFIFFKENKFLNIHFYIGLLLIILAVVLQIGMVYGTRKRPYVLK